MDLSLLISALNLLITTITEIRGVHQDLKKNGARRVLTDLLELMYTLDSIIDIGHQLLPKLYITRLDIQPSRPGDIVRRKEIIQLINVQVNNLGRIESICKRVIVDTPSDLLRRLKPKVQVSLGNALEIMVPANFSYVAAIKRKALTTVASAIAEEGEYILTSVFENIAKTSQIEQVSSRILISVPQKLKVSITRHDMKLNVNEMMVYDLTQRHDQIRLYNVLKDQLKELESLRKKLAKFINSSFSLRDLITN